MKAQMGTQEKARVTPSLTPKRHPLFVNLTTQASKQLKTARKALARLRPVSKAWLASYTYRAGQKGSEL